MSQPVTISALKTRENPLLARIFSLGKVDPLLEKKSFFSNVECPDEYSLSVDHLENLISLVSVHLQDCATKIIKDQNIILDKLKSNPINMGVLQMNLEKIRKSQKFLPRELQLQNLQTEFPLLNNFIKR